MPLDSRGRPQGAAGMCRAGQGIKPDVMLLSVGLWHMLHLDASEAFGRDLWELDSAVQVLQQLPGSADQDKARTSLQ